MVDEGLAWSSMWWQFSNDTNNFNDVSFWLSSLDKMVCHREVIHTSVSLCYVNSCCYHRVTSLEERQREKRKSGARGPLTDVARWPLTYATKQHHSNSAQTERRFLSPILHYLSHNIVLPTIILVFEIAREENEFRFLFTSIATSCEWAPAWQHSTTKVDVVAVGDLARHYEIAWLPIHINFTM